MTTTNTIGIVAAKITRSNRERRAIVELTDTTGTVHAVELPAASSVSMKKLVTRAMDRIGAHASWNLSYSWEIVPTITTKEDQ